MKKRILSLFLAVVMIVLAIPAVVLPTLGVTVNETSYKTGFSYKDIEKEYSKATAGAYPTGTTYDSPAGWEIALMSPTTWNDSYYVANVSGENGHYFHAGSGWMSGAKGGGVYVTEKPGQLVAPISYSGSGDDRTFNKLDANVLVRYTAEYTGTLSIDVSKLVFHRSWNAMFCILVNGQPVDQFDVEGFDYATGAGWYAPEADGTANAVDATANIDPVINVTVKADDVIDFVFRGNGCDGNTAGFEYGQCKRICDAWAFDVTYTSVQDYTNGASVQHVFDLSDYGQYYAANNVTSAAAIKNTLVQSGAWQMGWTPVSYDVLAALNADVESGDYSVTALDKMLTIGTGFTLYKGAYKNANSWQLFYSDNAHNGASSGSSGGFYQDGATTVLKFAPGTYFKEADKKIVYNVDTGKYEFSSESYASGSGELGMNRYLSAFPSVATLRYTALYGGDVTMDLNGTFSYTNMAGLSYIFVYVNGVRVKVIQQTDGKTQDFSLLTLTELKPGDTVDIMNVPDPRVGILMATEKIDKVDASGNKTGDTIDCPWYDASKLNANGQWYGPDQGPRRGFQITSITTTVTNPYVGAESVWNGSSAVASFSKVVNDNNIPLFYWYKKVEGVETRLAWQATLDGTCYAKINPVMAEAAGIDLEKDTYDKVLEKYVKYLTTTCTLKLNNADWQYGTTGTDGKFSDFVCYGYFHDYDIGLTKGGKACYPYQGQFVTSADGIKNQVESGWKKYSDNNVILDASKVADENATTKTYDKDTVAKNIIVNYSSALAGYKGNTSNGCAGATAQIGTNNGDINSVRPNNTYNNAGWGSFVYTASVAGNLVVNFDKLNLKEKSVFVFSVSVNGTYVIQPTTFDAGATGDASEAFLKTFNEQFKKLNVKVKAGDKVSFNFARSSGGVVITPVISASVQGLTPTFENTVNLSITDSYAVKVTAVPTEKNGTVDVLVDGTVVATLDAASEYTGVVKGGITVNQLTASQNATEGQNGTTIAYQLREARGDYLVTSEVFMTTTDKMLSYYEKSTDPTTKALAQNLRALANVSHWILSKQPPKLNGKTHDMTTDEKNWIKCGGANNFSVYGLTEYNGEKIVSAAAGALHTDWDSGLTDRMLATLKGYTAQDYYKSYWYKTEGDDTEKYAHFDPVEGVTALVEGVDFGYAEGTDFEAYDYAIAAANVNLGDKLSLVFLVKATKDADIWALKEGYTLTAIGDGVNVSANTFAGVEVGGEQYIGIIVDVPVSAYDKTLDIVIKDGEGNDACATMKYSVKAWCVNKYVFGAGSYNNYLVRAVYNVGVAAAAYQAAHPQPAN